jgi:hypothetical protein
MLGSFAAVHIHLRFVHNVIQKKNYVECNWSLVFFCMGLALRRVLIFTKTLALYCRVHLVVVTPATWDCSSE